jgi:hypothetical protein
VFSLPEADVYIAVIVLTDVKPYKPNQSNGYPRIFGSSKSMQVA